MVASGKVFNKKIDFYFYFLNFSYECLVLGQQEFAVEYRDKLYFLLNEETREKFMRLNILFCFY
jgi:hypothetical protein